MNDRQSPSHPDPTHSLRSLMERVGIFSFKALSRAAGVSEWQVKQLRQGRITQMRVEVLLKLSQALQISLAELLALFPETRSPETNSTASARITELQQEYQRLETKLTQQRAQLWQEFQQNSLQTLETWMLFWPTAAYRAQQDPTAAAVKVLPLLQPVEKLLQQWGVESIAPIGAEIPYDPQVHQLDKGTAQPGAIVQVTHAGYRQGDKLLFRVKVKPLE